MDEDFKVGDLVIYNNRTFRIHRLFKSGKIDIRRISDGVCLFANRHHIMSI